MAGNTISVNAVTPSDVSFLTGVPTGSTSAGDAQTVTLAAAADVTAPSASIGNGQSILTWTAPTGCYNQVMIVVKAASSVTGIPTGDGSAYTGNLVFGTGMHLMADLLCIKELLHLRQLQV